MVTKVEAMYHPDNTTKCERPLFMVPVTAGFPSPAEDYIEGKLDSNKHLKTSSCRCFPVTMRPTIWRM